MSDYTFPSPAESIHRRDDDEMALGKCPRRFQRQLFLASDFPVVGLVNVRVAFEWIAPDLAALVKVAEHLWLQAALSATAR